MTLSPSERDTLSRTLDELFFITLCCILPPLVAFADLLRLGHFLTESSIAEALQDVLLLVICIRIAFQAAHHPDHRGWLFLFLSVFVTMFIREHDNLLDTIFKGFWKVPALIWISAMLYWISRFHRQTIIGPMFFFYSQTHAFTFVSGFRFWLSSAASMAAAPLYGMIFSSAITPRE